MPRRTKTKPRKTTEKMTKRSINSKKKTAEETSRKSERIIKLITADQFEFLVEESIARELEIVRAFIDEEEFNDDNSIPLLYVNSKPLSKIIEYCKKHQEFRTGTSKRLSCPATGDNSVDVSNDAKAFDLEFGNDLTDDEMKELIVATNYLNVKRLLTLMSNKVADHIANKSVEYVRKFFGIKNEYAPEEEAQLRKEYKWAFEGVDKD